MGRHWTQLLQLTRKYPRNQEVLLAVLELAQTTQDWPAYAYYGEQLFPLERGEYRAQTLYNMIWAFLQLGYPAVAWQYAKELMTKHPNFEYIAQARRIHQTAEELLTQEAETLFETESLSLAERFEVMVHHDRVRFYTESNHPEEAINAAKGVLKKMPDLAPVLNNLSLAYFTQGKVDEAIATAEKVLTKEADNIHALGNLVRYRFLTAQFEAAQTAANQLLASESDSPDVGMKRAEAFSYLGNDEEVWAAYERAVEQDEVQPPILLHLAAVASYRMGNEARAWELWEEALEIAPGFPLAARCLQDKHLPIGLRDVPWYWPFDYWVPANMIELLNKHLRSLPEGAGEEAVEQAMEALLAEVPYLQSLLPHILERGDEVSRDFVVHMIQVMETPEMLQMLYDFGCGRWGRDEQRMEAMQFISQMHTAMLPDDKMVPIWVDGERTELLMLGFDVQFEAMETEGISPQIMDKHRVIYKYLMEDDLDAAEPLLLELIEEAPDFPPAYNQLAVVYEKQERSEEMRALIEEAHERFPDYLFPRIGFARMLIREREIERARAMVQPILRRHKLHISEFQALAMVQMELALADDMPEAARKWLDMWKNIEEDAPEILEWEMRIDGPHKMMKGL